MPVMEELAAQVGVRTACEALGIPRSSRYAAGHPRPVKDRPPAPPPLRSLTTEDKTQVRDTLNSDRFADQAPREVYATLLDEGIYLCSIPSMYRILRENAEVQERRNQLRHPAYAKPQLVATGPNKIWTWDITKLLGPAVGVYFYLYVLLDLFSRFVVVWLIAEREAAALAEKLILDCDTGTDHAAADYKHRTTRPHNAEVAFHARPGENPRAADDDIQGPGTEPAMADHCWLNIGVKSCV
jgi:putative transposase